jgi:hypothetical protein
VYFGQTEIARRGYEIFVTSIEEFLAETGAEAAPTLSQRLATGLMKLDAARRTNPGRRSPSACLRKLARAAPGRTALVS